MCRVSQHLLLAALLLASGAGLSAAPTPAPPSIAAGSVSERLAAAAALRKTDPRALARALLDLDGKKGASGDLKFLSGYAVTEPCRLLRLAAVRAAAEIDAEAAALEFLGPAAGTDPLPAARAIEALAWLGAEEQAAAVGALVPHASAFVGAAAADALARLAGPETLPALLTGGLATPHAHVVEHLAWAARDAWKKPSKVADALDRIARADETLARNAGLAKEALAAGGAPHRWKDPLKTIERIAARPPAEPRLSALNDELQKWLGETYRWLAENDPAGRWLVGLAFDRIFASGRPTDTRADFEGRALDLGVDLAGRPPAEQAVEWVRYAVRALQAEIGAPADGHRGWEAAYLDTCELAVVAARAASEYPTIHPPERYLEKQLALRPWILEGDDR